MLVDLCPRRSETRPADPPHLQGKNQDLVLMGSSPHGDPSSPQGAQTSLRPSPVPMGSSSHGVQSSWGPILSHPVLVRSSLVLLVSLSAQIWIKPFWTSCCQDRKSLA